LIVCVWVAFDQQFSPRILGRGLPLLTFYYLGALSVGYFVGYALLVFGESRSSKSWHRRSAGKAVLNRLIVWAVWIRLIAVPAALVLKNFPRIRLANGEILEQLPALAADSLPREGAIVLSDDAFVLLMLEGYLTQKEPSHHHLLL